MLLNSANIKTETNCNAESSVFKIETSSVAFDILSSKLYSNPILAIVRELCTNAYDSHKAAGKEDVPIKINIPSHLEPNFIIRDYGLGLSKEDIMEMYTTFFSSTKSSSNDFTGCFGLGSKTPFSYTSSFTVNSYWNGIKYFFVATKKDGLPHIFFVKEEPTEECNGLEISIPTNKEEGFDSRFYSELSGYLKYVPEIKVEAEKEILTQKPILTKGNVVLYEKEHVDYSWEPASRTGICYIKQGQNTYKVNNFIDKCFSEEENKDIKLLQHFLFYCDLTIEVPIGTLAITPSRESLSQEDSNAIKVKEQIVKVNSYLESALIEDISAFTSIGSSLNKLYNMIITDKYFGKDHPLNPVISTDYYNQPVCTLKNCYLHTINCSKVDKNSVIEPNKKSIILLVPSSFKYSQLNKLRNTISNYKELEDSRIYIILNSTKWNENILQFARNVKKTINVLNNMEDYDFSIEYSTITAFYRKYTKHRKKLENTNFNGVKVKCRTATTYLNDNCTVSSKSTEVVETLKRKHPIENTLVVLKDPKEPYNWDTVYNKLAAIGYFMHNIKSKSGDNVALNYFQKILPHLDGQVTLHVLEVTKSAKKYFKEYVVTSFNEIFSELKKADWTVSLNIDNNLAVFLEDFELMFSKNFKHKAHEFIKKTKSYKKLCILKKVLQNNQHKDISNYNTLQNHELALFKQHFTDVLNKKAVTVINNNMLSEKLKALFSIFKCSRIKNRSFTYRHISSENRLKVLNLLKGDL